MHIGRTSMPSHPLRLKYVGSNSPIQAFHSSTLANSYLQLAWDSYNLFRWCIIYFGSNSIIIGYSTSSWQPFNYGSPTSQHCMKITTLQDPYSLGCLRATRVTLGNYGQEQLKTDRFAFGPKRLTPTRF